MKLFRLASLIHVPVSENDQCCEFQSEDLARNHTLSPSAHQMAAAHQKAWCRELRSILSKMTSSLGALVDSRTPSTSIRHIFPLSHDLDRYQTMEGEGLPSTQPEYILLISEFTSFLSTLVPQLSRLSSKMGDAGTTPTVVSRAGTEDFWELWRVLNFGCRALSMRAEAWINIVPQQPFNARLSRAYHALLSWLLPMTRTSAWHTQPRQHFSCKYDLPSILIHPIIFLCTNTDGPAPVVRGHMTQLPPNFIPLQCCILSEQFSSIPPLVRPLRSSPHSQPAAAAASTRRPDSSTLQLYADDVLSLQHSMANVIKNLCQISAHSNGLAGRVSFLNHPAVLHFLKGLTIQDGCLFRGHPDNKMLSLSCLELVCHHSTKYKLAASQLPLSQPDQASTQDSAGLPLHTNPFLSTAAMQTDTQLLHVLSNPIGSGNGLTKLHTQLVFQVLGSWLTAALLYPVPAEPVSEMGSSLVGLAKQCSLHFLRLMKAGQCHNSGLSYESSTDAQHSPPRREAGAKLTTFEVARDMQMLMFTFSNFSLRSSNGEMVEQTGKGFETMDTWMMMPGWAATYEMMHRGNSHPTSAAGVSNFAIVATAAFAPLIELQGFSMLTNGVSLAATMRKLIWPHAQLVTSSAAQALGDDLTAQPVDYQQPLRKEQSARLDSRHVTVLIAQLLSLVLVCEDILAGISSNSSSISRNGRMTVIHKTSPSGSAGARYESRPGSKLASNHSNVSPTILGGNSSSSSSSSNMCVRNQRQAGGDGAMDGSYTSSSPMTYLQQLQAIGVLALVQLSRMRLDSEAVCGVAEHTTSARLVRVHKGVRSLSNQDLREVATMHLTHSSHVQQRKPQSEVGVMWERYAVKHLHGRLVPGCCNLACTNLGGVSEAGLDTLLCSGCRRARYCCVKCQRAAWVEGGHKAVCGQK